MDGDKLVHSRSVKNLHGRDGSALTAVCLAKRLPGQVTTYNYQDEKARLVLLVLLWSAGLDKQPLVGEAFAE